jgi:hypothetical protein
MVLQLDCVYRFTQKSDGMNNFLILAISPSEAHHGSLYKLEVVDHCGTGIRLLRNVNILQQNQIYGTMHSLQSVFRELEVAAFIHGYKCRQFCKKSDRAPAKG